MIFMGTPETAAYTLELLVKSGFNIRLVVTAPDKPAGRGHKTTPPPTKTMATNLGIKVVQPKSVQDDSFIQLLESYKPTFIIVIAYGKILPQKVLDVPTKACINVHYSLLPKHRGASPVHSSILCGDKQTGVTTMLMSLGMDEGDILQQRAMDVGNHTTATLLEELTLLGGRVIVETMKNFDAILPKPQDNTQATYTSIIQKTDGKIHWEMDAHTIERMVRGYAPWPSAYTTLDSKIFKITTANVINNKQLLEAGINTETLPQTQPCGTILHASAKAGLIILCGNNTMLQVHNAQLEGKRNMPVKDILNGKTDLAQQILGGNNDAT